MMISDLRQGYWHPLSFTSVVCAKIYRELGSTYQTPKVIHLYAQQCFGAKNVLPIDIWIKTFLAWPLGFSEKKKATWYDKVFEASDVWAKIERLIWLAAQSRKVHSSASAEILWCIRYGDPNGKMRGSNPMACKICADHIRDKCPAYASIANELISFNGSAKDAVFRIDTSAENNADQLQHFTKCLGPNTSDEYSARDRSDHFAAFPKAPHQGQPMKVRDFLKTY